MYTIVALKKKNIGCQYEHYQIPSSIQVVIVCLMKVTYIYSTCTCYTHIHCWASFQVCQILRIWVFLHWKQPMNKKKNITVGNKRTKRQQAGATSGDYLLLSLCSFIHGCCRDVDHSCFNALLISRWMFSRTTFVLSLCSCSLYSPCLL